MIAVDGENYDKEGKHFPKSIEKLDKVLKYIFSQLRICRDLLKRVFLFIEEQR